MMTRYLNATGTQMWARSSNGLCVWCGAVPDPQGCYCRYCDSCSEYWKDDYRKDYNDGRPSMKLCPNCEESETA